MKARLKFKIMSKIRIIIRIDKIILILKKSCNTMVKLTSTGIYKMKIIIVKRVIRSQEVINLLFGSKCFEKYLQNKSKNILKLFLENKIKYMKKKILINIYSINFILIILIQLHLIFIFENFIFQHISFKKKIYFLFGLFSFMNLPQNMQNRSEIQVSQCLIDLKTIILNNISTY